MTTVDDIRERHAEGYWWCDNKIEDANRDVAFLLTELDRLQAIVNEAERLAAVVNLSLVNNPSKALEGAYKQFRGVTEPPAT